MAARGLPSFSSSCISGREAAVSAVSEPENRPDRMSRTSTAMPVAIMAAASG